MSAPQAIRILLVEDDVLLRRGLDRFLALSGYQVTAVGDSLGCYRALDGNCFDVALIDLGLPDQRGETLIDYLRQNTPTAIVVITAHDNLDTRVACYRTGADLFFSKPVDGQELAAAIGSLVKRTCLADKSIPPLSTAPSSLPPLTEPKPITWTLQAEARTLVSPDGERLPLTAKEWTFFSTLATNPTHTSRQRLLMALYRRDDLSAQQALDTLLHRTRQKLTGKFGIPHPILNEYGIGYRFAGELLIEAT